MARPHRRQRNGMEHSGFALVVTISLLVLLMVLAVGLLSLSALTLRASAQGAAMSEARAWCEATVQRYPDPVANPAGSSSPLAELITPTSRFGRLFRILSFRWLSPAEI